MAIIVIIIMIVLVLGLLYLNVKFDTQKRCCECENRYWCKKHYYVCFEDPPKDD